MRVDSRTAPTASSRTSEPPRTATPSSSTFTRWSSAGWWAVRAWPEGPRLAAGGGLAVTAILGRYARRVPGLRRIAFAAVALLVAVVLVVVVTVVVTVRRPLPDWSGAVEVPGPVRRGRGAARRARRPADLRRHRRRPVLRAGLRPRPGPLLRDGPAPPHHRRPAVRAGGRERRRAARPTAWCARSAGAGSPSRSCRCWRRAPASTCRPTPTASTPTWRAARPPSCRPRYSVLDLAGDVARDRAVDAGRLAGLAQGDGLGPAQQLRRGARPGVAYGRPASATRPRRSRWSSTLYPPYPADTHAPILPGDGPAGASLGGRAARPGRRRGR